MEKNNKIYFEYEHLLSNEDVHKKIIDCEGRHTQTVAFSTFHDGLTQVCFGCKKVRSTIKVWEDH